MHLLMPLMDGTRMEPMVPGIIATLLDYTSLIGRIITSFDKNHEISLHYYAACYTVGILLFVFCRPYKKNLFNILDTFFILFLLLLQYQYTVVASTVLLLLLLFHYLHFLCTVKDTPESTVPRVPKAEIICGPNHR